MPNNSCQFLYIEYTIKDRQDFLDIHYIPPYFFHTRKLEIYFTSFCQESFGSEYVLESFNIETPLNLRAAVKNKKCQKWNESHSSLTKKNALLNFTNILSTAWNRVNKYWPNSFLGRFLWFIINKLSKLWTEIIKLGNIFKLIKTEADVD